MISQPQFQLPQRQAGYSRHGRSAGPRQPLALIAEQLGRDEDEIKKTLDATVKRRNDIVHRADRSQDDPAVPHRRSGIRGRSRPWKPFELVCLALDELVAERLKELRS